MDSNENVSMGERITSSCAEMILPDLNVNGDDKSPVVVKGCGGLDDKFEEEIEHEGEPKIGMMFDTTKEAYDFYNTYAKMVGFSVRILRTNKNKSNNNIIQRQALVCSCEGTYKKIKTPQRKRDIRRYDCKALFVIKRVPGDKYTVIDFKCEHSHDLAPPEHSHYLRSQRKIDFAQAEIMNKMHSSGLTQGKNFSYNDPMLTARYSELSHITQRIVSIGSRHVDVFNKCKSLLIELEGRIEACLHTEEDVNKSIPIDARDNSVANMQKECQLRDPTKRRSKGQPSKRIKGPLETKSRKKSSPTLNAKDLKSNHIMDSREVGMA